MTTIIQKLKVATMMFLVVMVGVGPDFVTFLRHVCKCLIIKGRSRCFG